jgi:hypothetical protein
LFVRHGALLAQPFDPVTRQASGEPVQLAGSIPTVGASPAFSASGDVNGDRAELAVAARAVACHAPLEPHRGPVVSRSATPAKRVSPAIVPGAAAGTRSRAPRLPPVLEPRRE